MQPKNIEKYLVSFLQSLFITMSAAVPSPNIEHEHRFDRRYEQRVNFVLSCKLVAVLAALVCFNFAVVWNSLDSLNSWNLVIEQHNSGAINIPNISKIVNKRNRISACM